MAEKKKKDKVKYIDDGRTIADMSNVGRYHTSEKGRKKATAREKWTTYFQAVKLMLIPMLITLGVITLTYFIMYLLLT